MDPNTEQFRRQFYQEARDILDHLSEDILRAEADPENREILNAVFRGAHTIKGSAACFELNDIAEFTHHLEGVLTDLRDGRMALTSDLVDAILAGGDQISAMIDDHAAGRQATINEDLMARFQSLRAEPPGSSVSPIDLPAAVDHDTLAPTACSTTLPPEIKKALKAGLNGGLHGFRVVVGYTSEAMQHGVDPLVFLQNLKEACIFYGVVESDAAIPLMDGFEPLSLYVRPVVYVTTELTAEQIGDLALDPSLISVEEIGSGEAEDSEPEADSRGSARGECRSCSEAWSSLVDPESFKEFLVSSTEMLESAEKAAIDYEANSSREALNEIFRVVHSIKGDADLVGIKDLKAFAHTLESLLERLRSGAMQRSPDVMDVILQSLDFLRQSIRFLSRGKEMGSLPPVFAMLEHFLQQEKSPGGNTKVPEAFSHAADKVFFEQTLQYAETLLRNMKPLPLDHERRRTVRRTLESLSKASGFVGLKALQVFTDRALSAVDADDDQALSEAVTAVTAFAEGLEGRPKRVGEILIQDGKITEEDLDEALSRQKPIGRILVEEGKLSETDLHNALKKQDLMTAAQQLVPAGGAEPEIRTMRVDEAKVEGFSNLIGELFVARNTYEYLLHQLGAGNGNVEAAIRSLKENLHLFSRLTGDMHHGVMSLRMIPVRGTFQKFNRVVRDISRKQKKLIDLAMEGEDIEIDKKVADMLFDPLVHIVRNACDHGIELPEERRAAGKPEKGTVILKASQEGNRIKIDVVDDGRGISRTKVYEKAQRAGFPVDSVDDPSLLDLIFMPGFSTKAEVTDLSGRGVGMDVVKTTMDALGGTAQVTSEEDRGSEISLSIPMTMGISAALIVEAGGRAYAIPLDRIVETEKLARGKLRMIGDHALFYYRGEVLPAKSLQELLDPDGGQAGTDNTLVRHGDAEEISMAIVRTLTGKLGVVVDRFVKNIDVAIKPVPGALAGIDVVSGVSVMGDGRVLLVLNPERF